MKKIISAQDAGNLLLLSFGVLAIFHVLVLLHVVPADIVWGGQVGNSTASFLTLEIIALLITLLFAVIIATKLDYLKVAKYRQIVGVGVWLIFAYLILNTLGNLVSGVSSENFIFAPISLVLAFLALRLAVEK